MRAKPSYATTLWDCSTAMWCFELSANVGYCYLFPFATFSRWCLPSLALTMFTIVGQASMLAHKRYSKVQQRLMGALWVCRQVELKQSTELKCCVNGRSENSRRHRAEMFFSHNTTGTHLFKMAPFRLKTPNDSGMQAARSSHLVHRCKCTFANWQNRPNKSNLTCKYTGQATDVSADMDV